MKIQNKNIRYKSREIVRFYSNNRHKWDEFYLSERWVFERMAVTERTLGDVLDVGCACGGLGAVLSSRFIINSYTGIDINKDAVDWAGKNQKLSVKTTFISGDIIKQRLNTLYDTVVSLGCADWNIETNKIIKTCWDRVRDGGYFIVSLRLTRKKGLNDIRKSYQHINFSGNKKKPEIANYVVFNFKEAFEMIKRLTPCPQLIGAYGYWGKPSHTAVTPFSKLVFAVFYVKKSSKAIDQDIKTEFNLPMDFYYKTGD